MATSRRWRWVGVHRGVLVAAWTSTRPRLPPLPVKRTQARRPGANKSSRRAGERAAGGRFRRPRQGEGDGPPAWDLSVNPEPAAARPELRASSGPVARCEELRLPASAYWPWRGHAAVLQKSEWRGADRPGRRWRRRRQLPVSSAAGLRELRFEHAGGPMAGRVGCVGAGRPSRGQRSVSHRRE